MPELTITSAMDPLFMWFAKEAGIPLEDYASQAGGEGIANGIELISDMILTPLGTKIVGPLIGISLASYALFGKPTPVRLRKEMLAIANHSIWRLVDPKPTDIIQMTENVKSLVEGVQKGDVGKGLAAFFWTPEEYGKMFQSLGIQQPPAAGVTPGPTQVREMPKVEVGARPRAPAPTPAPPAMPTALPQRISLSI